MKPTVRLGFVAAVLAASVVGAAAQAPPTPAVAPTDVYSVMFVKATLGQAAALAKQLQEVDPKDPMGSHFLLLRHQEGADWDYCLIQHAGAKATVEITPLPASAAGAAPTIAWHDDTYVSGPSWPDFQRAMGMTGAPAGQPVYIVSVQRAVPGHRADLQRSLTARAPGGKSTDVVMTHLDGGDWQFLSLSRYGSWQDLAADQAPSQAASDAWADVRKHSAYHTDTIADRVQ